MNQLIEILRFVSLCSFLIVALLAAINYKKFNRYPAKAMAWLIFFNAFFETDSYFTAFFGIANIKHYYVYFILELLLIPNLITRFPFMSRYKQTVNKVALIILVGSLFEIYQVWPDMMNTFTRILECMFFVVLCVFTSAKINDTPRDILRFNMEEFWMCQSIIIYFAAHAFVILASNYCIRQYGFELGRKIWMFNSIAAIFSNSFLIWCIWKIYLVKRFFKE